MQSRSSSVPPPLPLVPCVVAIIPRTILSGFSVATSMSRIKKAEKAGKSMLFVQCLHSTRRITLSSSVQNDSSIWCSYPEAPFHLGFSVVLRHKCTPASDCKRPVSSIRCWKNDVRNPGVFMCLWIISPTCFSYCLDVMFGSMRFQMIILLLALASCMSCSDSGTSRA